MPAPVNDPPLAPPADHLGKYQLCTPAAAGTATGALTGLVVWLLMAYVPAFHDGVPEPVVAFIPVATAWLGHTIATWVTAHKNVPVPAPAPPAGGPATGV